MSRNRGLISSLILILLPPLTAILCLGVGRYNISLGSLSDLQKNILFNIRLPRILLAAFTGAGLACAGTAFQSLFSNPLATPDTLGIASGASFGAVLVMLLGGSLVFVQAGAFVFGMVACALVFLINAKNKSSSIIMIVLSGLVIASMFQALVALVKYVADPADQLPSITYWLMGSLSGASFKSLWFGLPFILLGVIVIVALRWRLNILTLSENEAKALGINLKALRIVVICAASIITASCVSMCGQIGWVGLLIPHLCRMIYGSDNKKVVPASLSIGSVFMMIIDTVARSATAAELPVSILTAIIGAPLFIILLKKTGGVGGVKL